MHPKVFISYSHKDEKDKERLLAHLGVLQKANLIDLWSDDQIGAGADWEAEIRQMMSQAKVAILLITSNFLNSEFILGKEVPALLERRRSEGLAVVPVIARACAWDAIDWLRSIDVRPKNGQAVWREGGHYVDDELTAIAREVAVIVNQKNESPTMPTPPPKGTSKSVQNPFIFGRYVPYENYIEREDLIDFCRDRLAGQIPHSIAISGAHGFGKTSLLHYLVYIAQQEQWGQPHTHLFFVYLDCSTIDPFTVTRFWRRILTELSKHAQDNLDLQERANTLLDQPKIEADDFQDMLFWLHQRQSFLILLLDEFDSIPKSNTVDQAAIITFLSGLRALLNRPDCPLTLVVATRERLDHLLYNIIRKNAGSPFYNNFIFESLIPFTSSEIDVLFKQTLDRANIEFDQADRDFLLEIAGMHPAFLQMAGYHLFAKRQQASLTDRVRQEITEKFSESAEPFVLHLWRELTPLEQSLLILIILDSLSRKSFPQLSMTAEQIHNQLQIYHRNLTPLEARGLIQKRGNSYQIFPVFFPEWIVRKIAAEDQTRFVEHCQTINEEALRQVWQTFRKLTRPPILNKLIETMTVLEG